MPIATLTFNLPEEDSEHLSAINGWKWKSVVTEIVENLRHELKYSELKPNVGEKLEEFRTWIFNKLQEEGLNLDD